MKIEDYIKSLPENIISGEDVQLPDHSFREIFEFVGIGEKDIFYHLGCGDGNGVAIALQKFNVKKAIGIDYSKEKIQQCNKLVKEKNLTRAKFLCADIQAVKFDDATVILFWFTDNKITENMKKVFENLQDGCRIITIWGPLIGCLPEKVDFPYIINKVPFKPADLKEQLLAIFGTKCIDFVTAWEYAERYTKAIGSPDADNDRFVCILQSLITWINAKNLGLACGDEIPEAIRNYMSILKTFFGIEVEHLLK